MSGCSPASIRNADIPALRNAGVTKAQFLAVWSENPDTGFSPAQLKVAGISIAEMRSHGLSISQIHAGGISIADLRSGGIADYLVFNEACNTPQTSGTAPRPTIRLSTTTLSSTDTKVVLEGKAEHSVRWSVEGIMNKSIQFIRIGNTIGSRVTETFGMLSLTSEYLRDEGTTVVASLSIPLASVFSNSTVILMDNLAASNRIELCPGSL